MSTLFKSVLGAFAAVFATITAFAADATLPNGATEVAISTTAASVSHKGEMFAVKADESYSNQAPAYVAKIGDTPYATLAEAVAAANEITDEQVTITMLADAEFDGDDLYANLVLDLSGKTITATGSYVFWFDGGSLLVKDSSTEKTGKIDGSASVGNVFLLMGEESLTIESGIIHANNNVIYTYGSGVNVTINGGELKSVIATGNIFYLVGANDTIVVNNGTFIGNVNPYAAGLSIKGGQFTVDVTSYCAPGYKAQKNTATGYYEVVEDRVETVDPSVAQAKIVLGGEEKYYATLADAVKAAQNESVTDLVITLMGETTATTAVSFNLSYKTVFNSVTFKQADATQPYFIKELYTGARMNDGAFIFDGVNITIPSNGQYMFEGNVKLINNSTITSKADANCFVYYANVTIEPGSKLNGVIDDIRGGTLTVDGGKTDGTVNSTPDLQDAFLHVNWADSKLVVKNGAYVKINSVNEIGKLTVNGTVEVLNAKLEVLQEIAISQNASMKVDAGSEINAGKITGAGKIIVDAAGMSAGDEISLTANLANFTGTLETVGNDDLEASIVDGKIVLSAKPVAKIGDTNYETLADAFAEAKDGDTITLLGDCELVSGIDIGKNITVDGAGYKVYAADIADDTEMFNIRSKVTITNLTFDADHKFSYGIQVQGAADVTLSDVSILYAGNNNWGAAVNLNGGKLFVSGDFTAFSGGENGGAFPFTGILYWGGDFKFADGVTASIADPTGATANSDLLLVGTVGLLSIEDADTFLSQFNIPSGFAPYTLALDADIVSSFGGFTGASPLPWNTIIDYGKQILEAIDESTTETQVTVGLLDDTVIPDVFVYEDANFSINGNGKTLTGTIDVTDNVGTISNVVLTSGTTFVMTNVTTGCVKFGDNVTISSPVTIVPPANYGVGSAPLIEFTDGSGVKPEDFVIDQSAVEIPEGTEFVVDGNKIVLGTPVAKIGEVKYASLLGAIAAAKSGDTVTLLGDCGITTGIILNKNITIDGGNFTLTAESGDGSLAQMVRVDSAATIKNITLAVNHKYDYGIQMYNPASDLTLENVTILYAGKAEGHKNGELLFGASVFLQQGNLHVKGKFTAFSGGETAGTFPFTGILYWPAGDTAPTFSFADGATASISDPTGATSDSDLLLVGAPGILPVDEADKMLSTFNIPAGFAPYTLKLDCSIVQGVGGGFTGASPLAWNTIIDYGKKILTVVNESTTETQVEVGILDDVEIPEVFVYEDANFSINGNGKELKGTIDFTDNVGTISNVVLTSDMTFVMTNVTEGCVKLGEGVIITSPVKVIPPDNFGRGEDSATLIEFAEGSGLSLEKFEIDTSTVQLPEGSQIVQDGNKIIVKLPIAQVGNRKFATLAEAFEAANDGDTVRVLYSFNTNETIVINKAVTFDFSGDVITNTASGAAIQVAAEGVKFIGGELVAKGDGIVVANGGSSVIDRGVYEVTGVALAGAVTVSGGTFNQAANVINAFKSDDCEAVDNGDGWCTVMDYVAQFGEGKYVFLQAAIDEAAATNPTVDKPATVTLLGNVAGSLTLPENVIISANGYTVQSVVDSNGYIVELHSGAYQVGKYPEPPPIRSIKIVGDKVQLSFVPRKVLASVKVLSTTDLSATTWTSEEVDVAGAEVGKEFTATVDKPDGNSAFFKIEFAYSEE